MAGVGGGLDKLGAGGGEAEEWYTFLPCLKSKDLEIL